MKSAVPSAPSPDLDWDLWLGRAAERPYAGDQNYEDFHGKYFNNLHKAYHPFNWRGWRAFGAGALGDMGCHIMDASFWALELNEVDPISIEADTEDLTDESYPSKSTVIYKFPARGKMPPLTLTWNDGGRKPKGVPAEFQPKRGLAGGGMLLIGEKGAIYNSNDYCDYESIQTFPAALRRETRNIAKSIRRPDPLGNPHVEWLQAIAKGDPSWAGSNFEYSVPLTKMVVLGNLAVLSGKKIEWDGEKLACTNVLEANQFVKPVLPRRLVSGRPPDQESLRKGPNDEAFTYGIDDAGAPGRRPRDLPRGLG